MTRRFGSALAVATALGGLMAGGAAPGAQEKPRASAAGKWVLERTPDGRPDFHGVWANNTVTPLQRPKQWEGKSTLTDAEIAELRKVSQQIYDNNGDAQFGDGLILAVLDKITKPGSYDPGTGNYNQFWLMILNEMAHDVRIIALDSRPLAGERVREWNGQSRGRWDGDTLVVETKNFSARNEFMGATEHMRLIERFTRVSKDILNYEFTVDDPQTWTRPWTGMIPLAAKDEVIYEYACHEGSSSMEGILKGHRVEEQEAAAKKSGGN
jgi:hypothetical protein